MIAQATLLIAIFQGGSEPQLDTNPVVLSEHDQNIMRRFDDLPEEEKQRIAVELQQQVLELDHPLCEAAQAALSDLALEPLQKGDLRVYAAAEYAPKLNLSTKLVKSTSKTWKAFEKRYFRSKRPDRSALWDWDYGRNLLLKPPIRVPRDVVIDLLTGRWPLDGKLAAYAEGALDHNQDLDAAADYFTHAYRDRSGKVFQGISLLEVWNAQTTFGISDVESIAFLRNVADNDRLTSPIPARLHDAIYRKIEVQFEIYRDYRNLRHALAQRFVNPNGVLPIQFDDLATTFDKAWVLMEHKPQRMASFLERHPTRQLFLAALAKELPAAGKEKDLGHWTTHWEARGTLAGLIRSTTLDSLTDEGLLGFRRR